MNKRIENPLIVNFIAETEDKAVIQNGRRVYVPTNAQWPDFTKSVGAAIDSKLYDSVIVHVDKGVDLDREGMTNNLNIKQNDICKRATNAQLAVLSDASKDNWYLLNPTWDEESKAHGYAPDDKTVLDKFRSFDDELKWQEHQAHVWSRMADMMPLSDGKFAGVPNHVAQLTDPARGLESEDLDEFWSFRSNKVLSPALMGDDMIGMPGIVGKEYDGFSLVKQTGEESPLCVRSLKTVGMSGIAIPMPNIDGNVPKYQIATDPSKINVSLKARAADGTSIQKSEYFDKKSSTFLFSFTDGSKSNLKVHSAGADGNITFSDVKGTFSAKMKQDVKQVLEDRGYDLPELIDRLQVVPSAKYIWQSPGTMVGSGDCTKVVSPSNAGFTVAREPKNGADDWIVLVAEGALKGRIVAKYADVQDQGGNSFGDYIAKDSGIIVAQVPGVSHAFVESVKPVYDRYNVKGTYIAMDADGRENLAVAQGIKGAYDCLSEKSAVKVMSWNPAQKGLDDALLAVAQKRITLSDMGLRFGKPETLFPLDRAKAPNPYRLDGTRTNKQEWKIEYTADKKSANERIKELQEETKRRAAKNLDDVKARASNISHGGDDLSKNLPSDGQQDGQAK